MTKKAEQGGKKGGIWVRFDYLNVQSGKRDLAAIFPTSSSRQEDDVVYSLGLAASAASFFSLLAAITSGSYPISRASRWFCPAEHGPQKHANRQSAHLESCDQGGSNR